MSDLTRPTMTGGYPEPADRDRLLETEWDWCGYHKTHPMVSYDPAGPPYCWEGYWYREVGECESIPPMRVRIVEIDDQTASPTQGNPLVRFLISRR